MLLSKHGDSAPPGGTVFRKSQREASHVFKALSTGQSAVQFASGLYCTALPLMAGPPYYFHISS